MKLATQWNDIPEAPPVESPPPAPPAGPGKAQAVDESPEQPRCFPLVHVSEIDAVAESQDFVQGILTAGGASVVYGRSNTGKSFFACDLAASVATGRAFRDEHEVEQGAVVYVGLEGSGGIRNRILAMKREELLDDDAPFYMILVPFSLISPGDAQRMAETVKETADKAAMPCRLVVIDTLARAMAGGDENSGADMSEAVRAVDMIREATGAHVLLVHHCGKDEAKGARGHSSLRAAVDTEIEVVRPDSETITTARATKQRDLSLGDPWPFSLRVVELGTDRRGQGITSCVLHHEAAVMAHTPGRGGRKAKCTAAEMLAMLPVNSIKDWQLRVQEETGLGQSQFYELKKEVSGKFRKLADGRIVAI